MCIRWICFELRLWFGLCGWDFIVTFSLLLPLIENQKSVIQPCSFLWVYSFDLVRSENLVRSWVGGIMLTQRPNFPGNKNCHPTYVPNCIFLFAKDYHRQTWLKQFSYLFNILSIFNSTDVLRLCTSLQEYFPVFINLPTQHRSYATLQHCCNRWEIDNSYLVVWFKVCNHILFVPLWWSTVQLQNTVELSCCLSVFSSSVVRWGPHNNCKHRKASDEIKVLDVAMFL